MRKINEVLEKYNLKAKKYFIKGKTTLVETDQGSFALKERNRDTNKKILDYLNSRSFDYYPKILYDDDSYVITERIDEVDMPSEQKMMDMIDLVSLLHNKTTHYKEVDLDDYKKLYEDISNNIVYLTSYYDDFITVSESHIHMSPSEYLLVRNASKIYVSLKFAKEELEKWYELIKEKRKQRLVVLHNNLDLSHFIRNKTSYFLSWDKSKIGLPIFDLYKLYRRHGVEYEFSEMLKRYERSYPLLKEERMLLFILMAMPNKIDFDESEYEMCTIISRFVDELYKSEMIISPYYSEKTQDKEKQKEK